MDSAAKPTLDLDQQPDAPASKISNAIAFLLVLAISLYLLACLVSSCILSFNIIIPVTQYDLDNSSWLGISPAGFLFMMRVFSSIFALYCVFSILITQRFGMALISALLAASLLVASFPSSSFRLGAWQGDARIGCYSYQSKECREMLNAPSEGFQSIYSDDKSSAGEGRFAPWYQEVRAGIKPNLRSSIPSAIPGLQFFKAPWVLAHADEINATLEAQRAELKTVRSSSTLP